MCFDPAKPPRLCLPFRRGLITHSAMWAAALLNPCVECVLVIWTEKQKHDYNLIQISKRRHHCILGRNEQLCYCRFKNSLKVFYLQSFLDNVSMVFTVFCSAPVLMVVTRRPRSRWLCSQRPLTLSDRRDIPVVVEVGGIGWMYTLPFALTHARCSPETPPPPPPHPNPSLEMDTAEYIYSPTAQASSVS